MLGTDAGIVESHRDRVRLERVACVVLQEVAVEAVHHPGLAERDRGAVLAGVQAQARRLGTHERRPPSSGTCAMKGANVPMALLPPPTQATTASGSDAS